MSCCCIYSEVVDKGGIDPLITLLNDAKPLVQANAAVSLTNLATEGIFNARKRTIKTNDVAEGVGMGDFQFE